VDDLLAAVRGQVARPGLDVPQVKPATDALRVEPAMDALPAEPAMEALRVEPAMEALGVERHAGVLACAEYVRYCSPGVGYVSQ
jgi:hypothetical protein